jgi:hypothetical protein
MPVTLVPKTPKPVRLVPFANKAIRHIESITLTALSCSPTNIWSVSLLEHIASAMRNGADELQRAVELRCAESRALHQEQLAALRQREAQTRGRNNA